MAKKKGKKEVEKKYHEYFQDHNYIPSPELFAENRIVTYNYYFVMKHPDQEPNAFVHVRNINPDNIEAWMKNNREKGWTFISRVKKHDLAKNDKQFDYYMKIYKECHEQKLRQEKEEIERRQIEREEMLKQGFDPNNANSVKCYREWTFYKRPDIDDLAEDVLNLDMIIRTISAANPEINKEEVRKNVINQFYTDPSVWKSSAIFYKLSPSMLMYNR